MYIIPAIYFTVLQQVNRSYIIRARYSGGVCASSRVDDYLLLIFLGEIFLPPFNGLLQVYYYAAAATTENVQKEEEKEWNVRNRLRGGRQTKEKNVMKTLLAFCLFLVAFVMEVKTKGEKNSFL